jgi:hypothetical protein
MSKAFLTNGKLTKVGDGAKPDYYFPSSSDFFSTVSNLIPGISSVSGGRILLGDKSFLQAISLVNRQSPLVHATPSHEEDSFVKEFGNKLASVIATHAGTVKEVTPDEIKVDDKSYELYNNFLSGRKSHLHFTAVVRVGDKVKKGDLLATSNYSDAKGNLALGTNLTTAVMPYRSLNFEDAFVVTEGGAKKLQSEQLIPIRVELSRGVETKKNKFISLFANKFFNTQLSNIDEDGVVKKGTTLKYGDPIVLVMEPRTLKTLDVHLGNLSKLLKNSFNDRTELWEFQHDGEVIDVAKTTDLITVTVKTQRALEVGDKISVFSGNKGIVGSIIPESQAPVDETGKPVDLILNSMSITSRVAPGILNTMAVGKVAEKLGHPIKMTPFLKGSSVKKAIELLKKHKVNEMEKIYDPVSGQHMNVFVGPLYVQRLVHIAEDKTSGRSEGTGYDINMQPSKASDDSAKRIGNLATNSLLAHNATAVLRDVGIIRSTKNDEYWRRLKLGQPLPAPKIPFVFDKLVASLQGAGVKVEQKGDNFKLIPQTDKDVEKLSEGPIVSPATYRLKNDQLVFEKGGLFDENIVGILGNRYNHIPLNSPVPNPISEDYLRKLLKVTKHDFDELVATGEIDKRLKAINLDETYDTYVKKAKNGKKTERDEAVKVLGFLKNLKSLNIHPKDLMLHNIPIIPAIYRPISLTGGRVLSTGLNELYRDLILNNNSIKVAQEEGVPEDVLKEAKKKQYDAVKAVFGLGDPISLRNEQKGFKGILASTLGIRGGSAKESFFQSKVINKPVDLVGRAVLTSDVRLNLDEASVPQDLLWKVYTPFVIRRLVTRGVPATNAKDYVDKRNPIAIQALQEELRERPGLITRDPMLHKYNIQGFYLKPNPNPSDMTIKLNPLLAKSFNFDHDGDQVNFQIPASEDARLEVIEKMMPSKNLITPRTMTPIFTPSNESALGLYLASTEENKKAPQKFKNDDEVFAAFNSGKLDIADKVEIPKQ